MGPIRRALQRAQRPILPGTGGETEARGTEAGCRSSCLPTHLLQAADMGQHCCRAQPRAHMHAYPSTHVQAHFCNPVTAHAFASTRGRAHMYTPREHVLWVSPPAHRSTHHPLLPATLPTANPCDCPRVFCGQQSLLASKTGWWSILPMMDKSSSSLPQGARREEVPVAHRGH